jgi:hypothetical protein
MRVGSACCSALVGSVWCLGRGNILLQLVQVGRLLVGLVEGWCETADLVARHNTGAALLQLCCGK